MSRGMIVVFAVLLGGLAGANSLQAATLVVDTDEDGAATFVSGVPTCASLVDSGVHCTLRAALQTAAFEAGYQTIVLQRGVRYVLSIPFDRNAAPGSSGALLLASDGIALADVEITVADNGTPPGAGASVADVFATISSGATFDDSVFHLTGAPGAPDILGPSLELNGIMIVGSDVATTTLPAAGGAVRCDGHSTLALRNVFLSGNFSAQRGGAIAMDNCTGTFELTEFVQNGSGERGGAIDAVDSDIFASAVGFQSNGTIDGNGGAIASASTLAAGVSLNLDNATFSGGAADQSLIDLSGTVQGLLRNVTAVENSDRTILSVHDAEVAIGNSVVADNDTSTDVVLSGTLATLTSLGHNRIGSLLSAAPPSLLPTDRLLFHGSRVFVTAAQAWRGWVGIPLADSPLIGKGTSPFADGSGTFRCPQFDAELHDRKAMNRCDIGAANSTEVIFRDGLEGDE